MMKSESQAARPIASEAPVAATAHPPQAGHRCHRSARHLADDEDDATAAASGHN